MHGHLCMAISAWWVLQEHLRFHASLLCFVTVTQTTSLAEFALNSEYCPVLWRVVDVHS